MKKQIAILLLVIHVSVNTEAGQLFRLPSLVRHYQKHLQGHADLTVGQFILMHYAGNDGPDKEHEELPFRNLPQSSVAIVYAPMISFVHAVTPCLLQGYLNWRDTREELFCTFSDIIIQPPRPGC